MIGVGSFLGLLLTGTPLCRRTIYDDPFIRNYIEDLLKNIRTQVMLCIGSLVCA